MIIIYDAANILGLPFIYKGRKGNCVFVPGRNEIDPGIWQAVRDAMGTKRMEYYDTLLTIVEDDKGSTKAGDITVDKLNARKAIELVENTMEVDELEKCQGLEDEREKGPRKTVMDAIDRQVEKIETFKKDREEKSKVDEE